MRIEKSVCGTEAEWKLSGWLDTQTAPMLEKELNALGSDVKCLTLDFSEIEYISSAGLSQIVWAYKKMNGALVLRHVSTEIMGVFNLTGLAMGLTFE